MSFLFYLFEILVLITGTESKLCNTNKNFHGKSKFSYVENIGADLESLESIEKHWSTKKTLGDVYEMQSDTEFKTDNVNLVKCTKDDELLNVTIPNKETTSVYKYAVIKCTSNGLNFGNIFDDFLLECIGFTKK